MIERILLAVIFLAGFCGVVVFKNVIKKIFGLNIMNSAVVILFVYEGGRIGNQAPIMEQGVEKIVDPVPQALMLTAIVIGLCVTAFALALAFRLYRATGSLDIDTIRERLLHEN